MTKGKKELGLKTFKVMSGFSALWRKKAILQITSIKAQLFALRVLLTDAPKIRTDQALSSKQKQTLFFIIKNTTFILLCYITIQPRFVVLEMLSTTVHFIRAFLILVAVVVVLWPHCYTIASEV